MVELIDGIRLDWTSEKRLMQSRRALLKLFGASAISATVNAEQNESGQIIDVTIHGKENHKLYVTNLGINRLAPVRIRVCPIATVDARTAQSRLNPQSTPRASS